MLFKPLDIGIMFFTLAAVIASFFAVYAGTGGHSAIILKGDNAEWVFPLNADEEITVSGPLGVTHVAISGGRAQILSSPCMNQSCVASGAVQSPGQWAACLPNHVMLYIGDADPARAESGDDIDAAAW